MHIVILTVGSRGDVQPYIALAKGLLQRGHQVTIGASKNFEEFVTSHGVAFRPINADYYQLIDTPEGVVVPFIADQPFWGRLLVQLGVSPATLPEKKLSAAALANAIKQVMTDQSYCRKATEIAANIAREDGVGTAVRIVEGLA